MKKYKVTQEFMDELEDWQMKWENDKMLVNETSFDKRINNIEKWRFTYSSKAERNQRFGAIINWINGEDVFEIGTPKYIVRRNDFECMQGTEYLRIEIDDSTYIVHLKEDATRFDDFEEAFEWANKHFEVVEVDE